jgi:hypothetical protein
VLEHFARRKHNQRDQAGQLLLVDGRELLQGAIMKSLLCGYRLAHRGMDLPWCESPYEGYDREYFFDMDFLLSMSDRLEHDGSERSLLQVEVFDKDVYFNTVEEALRIHAGLSRYGKELDLLQIRLPADEPLSPQQRAWLGKAHEAPDQNWLFLGHDIGWLRGNHSIIYQPGFLDKSTEEHRQSWRARINQSGLFPDIHDARQYRHEFARLPNEHAEYYTILEVYRMEDTSSK